MKETVENVCIAINQRSNSNLPVLTTNNVFVPKVQ